jgi:hypothetical protein
MDWSPIHRPRPEDAKFYDIRLKDGTIVSGVEYWDHGGGFDPLPPGEDSPFGHPSVRYPLDAVSEFKPHQA